MTIDGLVAAYRIDTGEEVRIPPHWLDNPDLAKPFRTTPPSSPATDTPADGGPAGSTTSPGTTPVPDLGKKKPTTTTSTTSTTETPAAGAKE